MEFVFMGLAFFAAALAAYGSLSLVFSDQSKATRILQDMPEFEASQALEAEPLLRPFRERTFGPLRAGVIRLAGAMGLVGYRRKLESKAVRAGHPWNLDGDGLLTLKVFSAVIGLGLAIAVLSLGSGWAIPAIALSVLAWFVPTIMVFFARSSRVERMRRALPDVLDMLDISVRAGLGFDQALAKVVSATEGPLPEEFGRMLQEVQAGISRTDAMKHMSERVDVPDVNAFAVALIQADVFGVSVSKVLQTQASEMRLKRRQRAEEKAQKAPVYMVFPLVIFILPATILIAVAPAFIAASRVFRGF